MRLLKLVFAFVLIQRLCFSAGAQIEQSSLPDRGKTPGAGLSVTGRDVCLPGYATQVLPVSEPVQRKVFKTYGIEHPPPGVYEIDHLISLNLGGSNDPRNLWPEPVTGLQWNARVKDALEERLHEGVCHGTINLTAAQQAISGDWIAAYKKYFHSDKPVTVRHRSHTRRHRRARTR
jgi:hypothetical protein